MLLLKYLQDIETILCRNEINFTSHPGFKSFNQVLANTFFSNKRFIWFLLTLSAIHNYIITKCAKEYQNKSKTSSRCRVSCRFRGCISCLSFVFNIFSILKKVTWKECNMKIVDTKPGPPWAPKVERFATIFNNFAN